MEDFNRFDIIDERPRQAATSTQDDREVQELKKEYRQKLEENLKQLIALHRDKYSQKVQSDAKLRGKGGVREEAVLMANINSTFALSNREAFLRMLRPGVPSVSESELVAMAE